ncbi:MAG TPA: 4'-phosphopantetheinyl transferase superfamily protein [Bryobacteraceae bacterium]|nr:4'-phosphopantetheinyl transferase superfamily protein [Bryobacteraceae bacterium]
MRCYRLGEREVHVWTVRLEAADDQFGAMYGWLAPDEVARAERFKFEKHRRAYALGRAALRALLGGYLGGAPSDVRFSYGTKGKPSVADAASRLRFNASNSGELAVIAVTEGCELGVDVEHIRRVADLEKVAERFFAAGETAELMALPEAVRSQGFFNCWTRKEAYIKAVGDGFAVPLDSFRVTLRPGVAAQLLELDGSAEAARCWTMHDFVPAPDYIGALAYQDSERPVAIQHPVAAGDLL